MSSEFRVAALILTWNGGEMTYQAVASVKDEVDEVIVIDNASHPAERESLSRWCEGEDVTLIQNELNLGYAAGNNVGISYALEQGFDGILIMNNDALAEPGAVDALVDRLSTGPELGATSPMVVRLDNPDIVIHTACYLERKKGNIDWHDCGRRRSEIPQDTFSTDTLSGEAFLARSTAFRECGGFDDRFIYYFEDTEWSTRVRHHGWRLEVVTHSVFRHSISASMPSARAVYLRARNRPIYLRIGLNESRLAAAWRSVGRTGIAAGGLLRRGHPQLAMRAVRGWIVGVLMRDG